MIEGMEAYVGKKLKESAVQWKLQNQSGGYYIIIFECTDAGLSDLVHVSSSCAAFPRN